MTNIIGHIINGFVKENWVEDLVTCFLYFVWEIAPAIIVLLLFYRVSSKYGGLGETRNNFGFFAADPVRFTSSSYQG